MKESAKLFMCRPFDSILEILGSVALAAFLCSEISESGKPLGEILLDPDIMIFCFGGVIALFAIGLRGVTLCVSVSGNTVTYRKLFGKTEISVTAIREIAFVDDDRDFVSLAAFVFPVGNIEMTVSRKNQEGDWREIVIRGATRDCYTAIVQARKNIRETEPEAARGTPSRPERPGTIAENDTEEDD